MDDALRSFDGVLALKPTNLVALLGKVVYIHNDSSRVNPFRLGQNSLCPAEFQGRAALIPRRATV